jgi:hypothetical protein
MPPVSVVIARFLPDEFFSALLHSFDLASAGIKGAQDQGPTLVLLLVRGCL